MPHAEFKSRDPSLTAPPGAPAPADGVESSPLDLLLGQPHRLLLAVLALVVAGAWLALYGTGPAGAPAGHAAHAGAALAHAHAQLQAWDLRHCAAALGMWLLMSVAMMLPTAAPAILAYADIVRTRAAIAPAERAVAAFVAGYLLAWSGFALAATAAQFLLALAARSVPAPATASALLGGALFVAAGLYQFSHLKDVCLTRCRSPLGFFFAHWRDGVRGALRLGAHHGLYCVGCCAALMALMLCAGAMNLAWTATLTVVMLIEKVAPAGRAFARVTGVALLAWGGWLLASPLTGVPMP